MLKVILLALLPLSAMAAQTPQECLNIQNNLDRRYCLDKHLESIKVNYANEQKAWSAGVTEQTKTTGMASLTNTIAAKKDHIALLQNEMLMAEKQLETLKSAAIAAAPAPATAPVKKKKKDKRLIRFKF